MLTYSRSLDVKLSAYVSSFYSFSFAGEDMGMEGYLL
jgi:hypothetical protein